MTGVLILAGFAFGVMALGHCILGAVMRLPFTGVQATTFWVMVIACMVCGVLAIITFHGGGPEAFA